MTDKIHWRCFHCDATFTKAQERHARDHFGRNESAQPVCLIRSAGENSLLRALRDAEAVIDGYRAEDHNIMRAMYEMSSEHAQQLRNAEENGYNKGVADMSKLTPTPLPTIKLRDPDAALAIGEHAFCAGYTVAAKRALAFYPQRVDEYEAHMQSAWADYDPPEDIKALA